MALMKDLVVIRAANFGALRRPIANEILTRGGGGKRLRGRGMTYLQIHQHCEREMLVALNVSSRAGSRTHRGLDRIHRAIKLEKDIHYHFRDPKDNSQTFATRCTNTWYFSHHLLIIFPSRKTNCFKGLCT